MRAKEIKKIGDRISKKYGVYYKDGIIVERIKLVNNPLVKCVEARTELVSYEGGNEFTSEVYKKLGYESANLGGCIYRFYKEV
jgi:hypothetical protein